MPVLKEFYFYCHKNPSNHVHFYMGLIDELNKYLNIKLLTTTDNSKSFRNSYNKIYLRNKYKIIDELIVPFFLFKDGNLNRKNVIFRKRRFEFILLWKLFIPRVNIILELEGYPRVEFKYFIKRKNFFIKILGKLYYFYSFKLVFPLVLKKVNRIHVLSTKFKEILIQNYNIPYNKIEVFTTGVDNKEIYFDINLRNKIRTQYNINDRLTFIYMGNTNKWQNLDKLILFMKKYYRYNKNIFLFMILNEKKEIKKYVDILNSFLPSNLFKVMNVSHDKINNFLCASDIGMIFRENNLLNEVASPGKVGEYMVSGLKVLTTRYIGDYYKDLINNYGEILIKDLGNFPKDFSMNDIKGFDISDRIIFSEKMKKYTYKYFAKRYINSINSL